MTRTFFRQAGLVALLAASFGLCGEAHADDTTGIKAGVLSCHESSGWGFIFGSSRDMRCVFSAGGDRVEHYQGKISKFGVDIGYQQSGVLVWTVLAPTIDVAPGALAGTYGGVTAGASVGVGGSANTLIGGSNKSLMLQPLSIEGATGLNVAGGIAALNLQRQP